MPVQRYSSMMSTLELDPTYPRRIFQNAIEGAMKLEGHLLTAGEQVVIRRALKLDQPTLHVLARLHGRKRQPVRLDKFQVPGISDLRFHINALVARGFLSPTNQVPHLERKSILTVPELRELATAHGLSPQGNRATMIQRLRHTSPVRFGPEMVGLRHCALFRRLCRVYLQNHSGDLSHVVLDEMGVRSSASYQPALESARFRKRSDMREYEIALGLSNLQVDETNWMGRLHEAQHWLASVPKVSNSRWRFSARRFFEKIALTCLRMGEKCLAPNDVWIQYQNHLKLPLQHPVPAHHRAALAADRAGYPAMGMQLCLAHRQGDGRDFAAIRTGRRLARRAGLAWTGGSIPEPPKPFTLNVASVPDLQGLRNPSMGVENTVSQVLSEHNRRAFHVEGRLWSTLFGLLYLEAIFAQVRGMIPSPYMRGPTDLGTEGFRTRRLPLIETLESCIADGNAVGILSENWKAHHGESIAGVHWHLLQLPELLRIAELLPTTALVSIMRRFSTHWHHARRGWPDLVVLPSPSDPPQLKLIEVKGPNDSLRDDQRWWIATLLELGVPTEVWSVKPSTC